MRVTRNIEDGIQDDNILPWIEMGSRSLVGCGIVMRLLAGCEI